MSRLWDLLKNAGGEVGSSAIQRWREEVSRLLSESGGLPAFNWAKTSLTWVIAAFDSPIITDALVLHTSSSGLVRVFVEYEGVHGAGSPSVAARLLVDGVVVPGSLAVNAVPPAEGIAQGSGWWVLNTDAAEHEYSVQIFNGGTASFTVDPGDSVSHYCALSVEDVENQASRVA